MSLIVLVLMASFIIGKHLFLEVAPCSKAHRLKDWVPPREGVLKFNVDRAARGKLGLAGTGGVLWKSLGDVLAMFSKHVGIMESNELEVLAILEALQFFLPCSTGNWWWRVILF